MKVILLAGGYAERLYPLTKNCPKALLPLKKKPILDYILSRLSLLKNIDTIYLLSNELFFPHFQRWASKSPLAQKIHVISNGKNSPAESQGAIKDLWQVIENYSIESDVLVVASDNYFEDDLSPMIHQGTQGNSVIGLVSIPKPTNLSQYGIVLLDKTGCVTSLIEKPSKPPSRVVSTSIYYFTRQTLPWIDRYIQQDNNCDAPGYLIHWLAQRTQVLDIFWKNNGTISDPNTSTKKSKTVLHFWILDKYV